MGTVGKLKQDIQDTQAQIDEIQEQCSHPKSCVIKVPKASTGNWCPQDDSYWYQCRCSLCEKYWTEDQ